MHVSRQVQGTLQNGPNGWSDVWQYFVCDIDGNPDTRRFRAMSASGIPRKNDSHPDGIPGVRVTNITSAYDEADPDQVIVTVEFGGEAESTAENLQGTGIKSIEVSTSLVSQRTARDRHGNQMIVLYEGPEVVIPGATGGAFSPGTENQTVRAVYSKMLVEADYDLSITTVTVTTEADRPSHLRSEQVATRINSGRWSGIAANRVMCLGIDCNQNQAGRFDWRHIFSIAPNAPDNPTWLFRAENIVIGDALRLNNTVGNGIEFFELYEPINFRSAFGFEIPS